MGTLYVVATPIGNLEDMSLRALRVLREARLIAAEDTRHTRKLLTHYQIATRTISYHEHSAPVRTAEILSALVEGDVALVSDAGTPAVSDPGQALVVAALQAGHQVVPVPGPSAAIAALVASGLPTDQFTFLGFLPRRSTERRAALAKVRPLEHTLILYEAPHRLLACLDDALAVLGDRQAAVARELTKVHEEVLRGSLSALRTQCAAGAGPRGEYTLVVEGASAGATAAPDEPDWERARARLAALLAAGWRTRDAANVVASELGLSRRDAYRLALEVAAQGQL
jgi:16S rRNA (cytidine1402-2'-O)-methyltransferase